LATTVDAPSKVFIAKTSFGSSTIGVLSWFAWIGEYFFTNFFRGLILSNTKNAFPL